MIVDSVSSGWPELYSEHRVNLYNFDGGAEVTAEQLIQYSIVFIFFLPTLRDTLEFNDHILVVAKEGCNVMLILDKVQFQMNMKKLCSSF